MMAGGAAAQTGQARPARMEPGGAETGRAETARVLFEAVIVPHRSLSPKGRRAAMVAIAAIILLAGTLPAIAGAWPVVPFTGAELLLALLFFRWHTRGTRANELVILTEDTLRIIRTDRAGRRDERVLPSAWLRASVEERPGQAPLVVVSGQGRRETIGADLGETERRDLARALAEALHRARNPVFDNPVLRET
jgi:uncharacterized membrane protein